MAEAAARAPASPMRCHRQGRACRGTATGDGTHVACRNHRRDAAAHVRAGTMYGRWNLLVICVEGCGSVALCKWNRIAAISNGILIRYASMEENDQENETQSRNDRRNGKTQTAKPKNDSRLLCADRCACVGGVWGARANDHANDPPRPVRASSTTVDGRTCDSWVWGFWFCDHTAATAAI